MCNYVYQKDSKHFKDKPCVYPNLYTTNTDNFSINNILPIDEDGFCIFHSHDVSWKLKNGFREKFDQLIQIITVINSNINKNAIAYNFSGFFFCSNDKTFLMDNYVFEGTLDLSYTFFANEFCFSNSKINSLDLEHSVHSKQFFLNKTSFSGIIFSNSAKFKNGMRFTDCIFDRDIFFSKCTFSNEDKLIINSTILENCKFLANVDFNSSKFDFITCFKKLTFARDANFSECVFMSEFKFSENELNGRVDFGKSQFLLDSNPNPMDSSTSFSRTTLNKKGSLVFKGIQPFEDVVRGEMELHFKTEPEGIIIFENFNLNKIYPEHKENLIKLWKTGKAMVGRGCLKYLYQTPEFKIGGSDVVQKLIMDITKVFTNFFQKNYGYNLGLEIVEETRSTITYFYFSDDGESFTSNEDFYSKIKKNEFDFWQAFSNYAKLESQGIVLKGTEKSFYLRISLLFVEIIELIKHDNFELSNLISVLNSISSTQQTCILEPKELHISLKNEESLLNELMSRVAQTINVNVIGGQHIFLNSFNEYQNPDLPKQQ